MRRPLLSTVMTAALLASAPYAAAQPAPDAAPGSVLTPVMPDRLPAPTPIEPETAAPQPQFAAPPPPSPDSGGITAVPLPPPGSTPPPAPIAPTAIEPTAPAPMAPTAAVGAPVSLTPIPLALPPLTSPPAFPKSGAKSGPSPSIVAKLPTPALSDEASPADFLRVARGALAAGRNAEARSALEMAQTRLLDRVVDAGRESVPSNSTAVKQISEAIDALSSNDRMACLRYIEFASRTIGSPLD
jgi:hypothetical protein